MSTERMNLDNDDPTLQGVLDDVRLAMSMLGEAGENLHQLKRLVDDPDDVFAAIDKVMMAWAATANAVGAVKDAGHATVPVMDVPGLVPDVVVPNGMEYMPNLRQDIATLAYQIPNHHGLPHVVRGRVCYCPVTGQV